MKAPAKSLLLLLLILNILTLYSTIIIVEFKKNKSCLGLGIDSFRQ